jgi:hypothetical protein
MRKLLIPLVSFFLILQTLPAVAAVVTATGTNPSVCNQTVGNATNVVATRISNGDCVVQFKNIGTTTWTIPSGVTKIAVLIIAGGGGGGFDVSGGGGAGGLLYYGGENPKTPNGETLTVTSGNVTISVGDGGAGATQSQLSTNGANGSNSYITLPSSQTLTAIGGGGGNSRNKTSTAPSGGSGGGGGYGNGTVTNGGSGTGSGITLQGFAGGKIQSGNSGGGGGGGGAGGVGSNWIDSSYNPNSGAGTGGTGLQYSITGSATYFAGGGGGGSWNNYGGVGGVGGGGAGGSQDDTYCRTSCSTLQLARTGNAGTENTGGGGGGSGWAGTSAPGGKGGSGIVIIRYKTISDQTIAISTLGTPSKTYPYSQVLAIGTSGSSGGGSVTYSVSNGTATGCLLSNSSNTATISASTAGTCLVAATIASDANYNSATSAAATFTFAKATQSSISITSTSANFGTNLTLTSTGGSVGSSYTYTKVSGNSTVSGSTLTPTTSGTCVVRSSLATDANYLAAQSADTTITIQRTIATVSISLQAGTLVFRQEKTITVTANVAGKVTIKVNNKALTGCSSKNVSSLNSYIATCSFKPSTRGFISISVTLNPTDASYIGTTTTSESFFVGNRTGKR